MGKVPISQFGQSLGTDAGIIELMDEGERATWPRIERIRIQTRISRTLDPILQRFEEAHIEEFGKPAPGKKATPATRRRKAG